MANVAVVGAGIIGRAIAFELLEAGYAVTLFDANPAGDQASCSWQAGGMIAPWSEASEYEAELLIAGLYSKYLWPDFAKKLGATDSLMQSGTRLQYHPLDEALYQHFLQRVAQTAQRATDWLDAKGLEQTALYPTEAKTRHISQHVVEELKSVAERGSHSAQLYETLRLRLNGEAHVCPKCILQTLEDEILNRGGRWYRQARVCSIKNHEVYFKRQKLVFDRVIDATGLGGKSLNHLPVRGVRGEALLIRSRTFHASKVVRFLHPRFPVYLIPRRKDNLFYLGASQLESESSMKISLHTCMHLMSAAIAIAPELAEAELIDSYTGLRPAMLSNRPVIQVSNDAIAVNGFFRHGFLLAPLAARLVTSLLNREINTFPASIDASHFPGFDIYVIKEGEKIAG